MNDVSSIRNKLEGLRVSFANPPRRNHRLIDDEYLIKVVPDPVKEEFRINFTDNGLVEVIYQSDYVDFMLFLDSVMSRRFEYKWAYGSLSYDDSADKYILKAFKKSIVDETIDGELMRRVMLDVWITLIRSHQGLSLTHRDRLFPLNANYWITDNEMIRNMVLEGLYQYGRSLSTEIMFSHDIDAVVPYPFHLNLSEDMVLSLAMGMADTMRITFVHIYDHDGKKYMYPPYRFTDNDYEEVPWWDVPVTFKWGEFENYDEEPHVKECSQCSREIPNDFMSMLKHVNEVHNIQIIRFCVSCGKPIVDNLPLADKKVLCHSCSQMEVKK